MANKWEVADAIHREESAMDGAARVAVGRIVEDEPVELSVNE
jgi:hypothetical protein